MSEAAQSPGLEERLPADAIPGLFHGMSTGSVLGGVGMTDFDNGEPEGWSFQPYPLNDLTEDDEKRVMGAICDTRVHYHPRRMHLTLNRPIPSASALDTGADTEYTQAIDPEQQAITWIEFVIPPDDAQAEYTVEREEDGSRRVNVITSASPGREPLLTEVTCFHPVRNNRTMATDGPLIRGDDIYVTKEYMEIISDLPSDKDRMDHIEYETMTSFSLDASYFPAAKRVTRPAAADNFSYVTIRHKDMNTFAEVQFLVTADASKRAREEEWESRMFMDLSVATRADEAVVTPA
ncbi:hypothetical protein L202_07630 [Cryptococcus amylolentus CBS 6039]|uniref:Uncharacterized protein n=1 Tax=Cryptococcus amylolentus CBS 6039 TaxID=1295533 RepID=A0A1E3HCV4_9TREE|nr:hypothetical protein L202_07630 [Cryptococcus amylolentus CBS 6039]ODN74179.1 hypothetical protein L202_07630 [Cryptococcus amylolentus CBS 6039]